VFKLFNLPNNIFSVIFLIFLAESASAQNSNEFSFEHLCAKDGLSNSSVYAITQDHEGYLWFGTADGLNKYDGDKFVIYRHEPYNKNSLPDNWITSLVVDKDGDLWCGTYGGGISKFSTINLKFENYSAKDKSVLKLSNNIIRTLYADPEEDYIWIGTEKGINLFDDKNKRFKKLNIENSKIGKILLSHSINSIFRKDSILVVGTWGDGLLLYNLNSNKIAQITIKSAKNSAFNRIKGITYSEKNKIWIAYRGAGLRLFNIKNRKFEQVFNRENSNLSSDNLYSIAKYSNNGVWIGTYYNGLNRLDLKTKKIQNFTTDKYNQRSISGNWIPGLFIDRTNILWIGTDKGVSKLLLNSVGFRHLSLQHSNLNLNFEANINAICEQSTGKIWLGTWGQGILIYDRKKGTYRQIKSSKETLSSLRVWNIREDKNGKMWIGTGRALDAYDPKTNKWTHYYSRDNRSGLGTLPANNIASSLMVNDSTLMIGTWGGGVTLIDVEGGKVKKFDNTKIHGKRIKSLYKDIYGRIWFGSSNNGISVFNPKNNKWDYFGYTEKNEFKISGNDIECITGDNKNIWIATNNSGLNKIDIKSFKVKNYLAKDGLPTNSLRRIVLDSIGNLWISSQAGIIKYNPKTNEIKSFDKSDGLQSNEFTRGYAYLKSGEIAFGGNNGFNIFRPNKLNINKILPKIVISNFYIYNKKFNLLNKLDSRGVLKLYPKEDMLSFEFRALDFNAPQKNKYLYKLEGFDQEWRKPLDKPIVTYTNLPSGKYVFKVLASNNHGYWNTDGLSLKIRVYAPIYKTWEFFIILFIILIVLVIAYIKYREYNLYKSAIRLDRIIEEKTREVKEKNKLLERQKSEILVQNKEIERQKHEVEAQRDEVLNQKELIEYQKEQMTDSIIYAKTIQMAMMPDSTALNAILQKSFLLFKPKDIVSGDFVWIKTLDNLKFIVVADCTGHGVPGGFMSMFGISILNELILHEKITSSANLLEGMRTRLIQTMTYKSSKYASADGIDIGCAIWNTKNNKLNFAGAHIPLYIIRENELIEIPGDKMSVGPFIKYQTFNNKYITVEPKDKIYLFTDGFSDQFGGKDEKKYMKKNLKKLIIETSHSEMIEQEVVFKSRIEKWMGSYEQVDDITGLGFEID